MLFLKYIEKANYQILPILRRQTQDAMANYTYMSVYQIYEKTTQDH